MSLTTLSLDLEWTEITAISFNQLFRWAFNRLLRLKDQCVFMLYFGYDAMSTMKHHFRQSIDSNVSKDFYQVR